MSRLMLASLACSFLASIWRALATCDTNSENCAASTREIEDLEHHEAETSRLELLQRARNNPNLWWRNKNSSSTGALGGEHRVLLVRLCARFAGDGVSGLPRHRVTGDCCGDAVCSPSRWETLDSCPSDCTDITAQEAPSEESRNVLPPTHSRLFGELQELEHDEYHCEAMYNATEYGCGCSCEPQRPSLWLEDLLDRTKIGTLPFELPPSGSVAVEIGCGAGQDSRNMARMAGWAMTSVDVSPEAIQTAKNETEPAMLGSGPGQIEFVAYDGMALPTPSERVDFFFDATVYCGLRHKYLARDYELWSRIGTPGHTLFNIQCWNYEAQRWMSVVPQTRRDMEMDFEPIFDVLHSEDCEKNQGGAGWCFYMKLKSPEVRNQIFEDRLKLQSAVRKGDIQYVRDNLQLRSGKVSRAELETLKHIAFANSHSDLLHYVISQSPGADDEFFNLLYGSHAEKESIEAEDKLDGIESVEARQQVEFVKTDWERRESELLLDGKIVKLGGTSYLK